MSFPFVVVFSSISAKSRPTRVAANRAALGDSFISPGDMEHLSVLMDDTEFPASGGVARPKSNYEKTKKVKAESTRPEDSSSSVADLIQLGLLRICKENLATRLKIAETELKLYAFLYLFICLVICLFIYLFNDVSS